MPSNPDSPAARSPDDRIRIDANQDYDMREWARRFGVTHDQLKEAVAAVGERAADVEAHLTKKGSAGRTPPRNTRAPGEEDKPRAA